MNLNDAELASLESGISRFGDLFRLETDPIVRLWLGAMDLQLGPNVLDAAGGIYRGMGQIGDFPEFDVMINGAASRVEFTISGVSGAIADIAMGNDRDQVRGKRVSVGFVLFGEDWQPLGPAHWYAHYRADYLGIDREPVTQTDDVASHTIRLSCGSLMTMRRRPARSYFSDADQQARFAGDLFCSLAAKYAHGFTKPWPVFPS